MTPSATDSDVSFYGYVGVFAGAMLLFAAGTVVLMCLAGLVGINLFSGLRLLSVVMLGGFNLLLLCAAYDMDKNEKAGGHAKPEGPKTKAQKLETAGGLLTLLACTVFMVACVAGIFGVDLFSTERVISTLMVFGLGYVLLTRADKLV